MASSSVVLILIQITYIDFKFKSNLDNSLFK